MGRHPGLLPFGNSAFGTSHHIASHRIGSGVDIDVSVVKCTFHIAQDHTEDADAESLTNFSSCSESSVARRERLWNRRKRSAASHGLPVLPSAPGSPSQTPASSSAVADRSASPAPEGDAAAGTAAAHSGPAAPAGSAAAAPFGNGAAAGTACPSPTAGTASGEAENGGAPPPPAGRRRAAALPGLALPYMPPKQEAGGERLSAVVLAQTVEITICSPRDSARSRSTSNANSRHNSAEPNALKAGAKAVDNAAGEVCGLSAQGPRGRWLWVALPTGRCSAAPQGSHAAHP